MKLPKLTTALFTTFLLSSNLHAQSDRSHFGMEPFYNYGIYLGDQFSNPNERINIVRLGFYSEYQLSKQSKKWTLKSGLYYFQFHSSFNHSGLVDTGCNNTGFPSTDGILEMNEKYISHNLRIPIIIKYKIKKLSFYGGLLFDFELTNKEKTNVTLNADEICNGDSQ